MGENLTEAHEKGAIVIAGGSGLIGSALRARLESNGHQVLVLTRNPQHEGEVGWDPSRGELDESVLAGCAGVINLAGASLADGRWTSSRKRLILESRVDATRLLAERVAAVKQPPPVFLSASAVGYYPLNRDQVYTENGPSGEGFLASVCTAWEQALDPLRKTAVRVVILRMGVVLSWDGGVLAKLRPLFRSGLGGPVGSGNQRMSWISLTDLVRLCETALSDSRYKGVINAVAPEPVSNREFSRALGKLLGRPAYLPAPAFALRLAFGEMAEETVLADNAVRSARLPDLGFTRSHPTLEDALRETGCPQPPSLLERGDTLPPQSS